MFGPVFTVSNQRVEGLDSKGIRGLTKTFNKICFASDSRMVKFNVAKIVLATLNNLTQTVSKPVVEFFI